MATIIIRNSTGSGAVPSSLVQGELAINTVDGKLFYGSGSGNIVKEFTGSSINTSSFFVQGGNSFGAQALLGTNDNQSLAFETSGSTRMFISSSGNVGIKIITPSASLHVSGSTLIGNITAPALNDTTRVTANIGITTIYSIATGSYDGTFFDYTIRSGSNARAGQIMGIWSGSSVNFTETTTTDFGSTSNFTFGMSISASNMILSGSTTSNGWTVKTIVRSI